MIKRSIRKSKRKYFCFVIFVCFDWFRISDNFFRESCKYFSGQFYENIYFQLEVLINRIQYFFKVLNNIEKYYQVMV